MSKSAILLIKAIRLVKNASPSLFFLLCLMVAGNSILPILTIKASGDIINHLAKGSKILQVYVALIFWGTTLFLHNFISPIIAFLQSNLGDKTVLSINQSIMNKSNSLKGLEHFENSEFYNDLQVISSNAHNRPINLVVTLIGLLKDSFLIIYTISLLFLNISYVGFVILTCVVLHTRIMVKTQTEMWFESFGRSLRARMMNYISNLQVNPTYSKEVRLFPIQEYLYKRYIALFEEIYSAMYKLRTKLVIWPILPSVILLLGNIFVLDRIIRLIMNKNLEVGVIVITIQCVSQLHSAILSFGEQAGWLSAQLLFFEKYFKFLSKTEDSFFKQTQRIEMVSNFSINKIKFQDVSFNYPDNRVALKNINFEISDFDKLAIVGPNGSGKTTLIKLICGFYRPTLGKILINDLPIEDYNLDQLRNAIAPVFQDFGTYGLSVEENVAMGDKVNTHKIETILKKLNADFVFSMPNKIKHQLGKAFEGTELSTGQWQKIAIARAMYKGGSLFILDEPSSSLDPLSEHEIFKHFTKMCADKMVILVTHRLTTISISNKILLLNDGYQIAFDSHQNLILSNPLYKKIFNAQASKFLDLSLLVPKGE